MTGVVVSANLGVTGEPALGGASVAQVTVLTSTSPGEVSKILELKDGAMVKTPSANVTRGRVDIAECDDLAGFAGILAELKSSQCLIYGLPKQRSSMLLSDRGWRQAGMPATAISRTEQHFAWRRGPGILMLDHDPQPGMQRFEPGDLVSLLRQHVPVVAEADMLAWPSASSLIFDERTGDCVAPMKGCRVYLMLEDASVAPVLGRHIVDLLWNAGHGVFAVSKSGRCLERGLFDTSVWQPNRIDFAAGAICRPPLVQRRGSPMLHAGSARRVRVSDVQALALNDLQSGAVERNKQQARSSVAAEALAVAEQFKQTKTIELRAACEAGGLTAEVAQRRAEVAAEALMRPEGSELHGEVVLHVIGEDGQRSEMTVREVLKRRLQLDRALTLDPLEPDYNGGAVVGKLYLDGAVPRLFSFAHGGSTYKLVAQQGDVQVAPGMLHRAVDESLNVLRACGDLYDHGDALVTVEPDGRIAPVTQGLVPYVLSSRVSYFSRRIDRRTGDSQRREEDPPTAVAKSVFELGRSRAMPRLNAVITAPIIVGSRVVTRLGYDAETGLLLVHPNDGATGAWNEQPTPDEAMRAFERLLDRFRTFPFDTPADVGAFAAALFTAVMRPGLRTAPGFAFDAPAQGSGKSLLSDCVAIIGAGEAPSALPHIYNDEAEVRKRLASLLSSGAKTMIWDNIMGTFNSAALASLLTSEEYGDRLLGESRIMRMPNRMLALFNGNNMSVKGELTRRIVTCRLDAGVERPYLRKFSTSPRETCLAERQAIVRDVLTVIRCYQLHGEGYAGDVSLGSFESWSKAVLRPILWMASFPSVRDEVCNPLEKIASNEDVDETLVVLGQLLAKWHETFGEAPKTAGEVSRYRSGQTPFDDLDETAVTEPNLQECIDELIGKEHRHAPHAARATALGKQLSYHQGRVVGGRRFERAKQAASGGVARWSVVLVPHASVSTAEVGRGGGG